MEQLTPEYTLLFHNVNKAVQELENAVTCLKAAQQQAEAAYLERTEPNR